MDYMKVIPSSISEAIPKPGKLILISYFCFVLGLSVAVLSTSETLQCIKQQVLIVPPRSHVHVHILHVSFCKQCFTNKVSTLTLKSVNLPKETIIDSIYKCSAKNWMYVQGNDETEIKHSSWKS